jgi:hypothetical protein
MLMLMVIGLNGTLSFCVRFRRNLCFFSFTNHFRLEEHAYPAFAWTAYAWRFGGIFRMEYPFILQGSISKTK